MHLWSYTVKAGSSLPYECYWQEATYRQGASWATRVSKSNTEGESPHGIPLILTATAVPLCNGWGLARWNIEVKDVVTGTVVHTATTTDNPASIIFSTSVAPDGDALTITATADYTFTGDGKLMRWNGKLMRSRFSPNKPLVHE